MENPRFKALKHIHHVHAKNRIIEELFEMMEELQVVVYSVLGMIMPF